MDLLLNLSPVIATRISGCALVCATQQTTIAEFRTGSNASHAADRDNCHYWLPG